MSCEHIAHFLPSLICPAYYLIITCICKLIGIFVVDLDLWPTEITMLSGNSQENMSDLVMPSTSEDLDMGFVPHLWQNERSAPTPTGEAIYTSSWRGGEILTILFP